MGDDGDLNIGLDDGTVLWSTGTAVSDPVSRPHPVRTISVTPGDRSLAVSWTAPGDGGSRITGYEVSYIESQYVGCGDCGVVADVFTTTSLRATISGLTNGTSYTVYVRARNSVGVGLWVTNAAGTPVASASVPGKVGRPSVSAGDGSLSVSWSAPSDGGSSITGYEVWYSPQTSSQSWTRTITARSVTLTGLSNGISYAVYVRAKNTIGSGSWSDAAAGTPVTSASVPGKVGRPSVSAGDGSLTVSWSAPSNGGATITSYGVWARSQDGTHERLQGAWNTTSVTLTGLTNGKTYNVFVRAKNSVGSGLWSSNAAGTPVAAATVPGKVGRPLVSAGDGSLTVSWSAPSNGGSAITGYDVRARSQDGTHEVTRGTSGTTSVTVTRLTNDKSYNVFVRARNSVGSGSWSDSASGTPVAAATAPGKVGRPSVSAGDGSLTVSWSTPSDGGSAITGYEVWYSPQTSSQSWTRTTTATSVTLTGLTNGTSYRVHVRAQNSQDFGSWSDAASGTPVGAATVPDKVGQPSLVAGDGSLTVSWWPPSDGGSAITDYDVRYVESSYIGCADCGALPWVNWQSSTVSTWRSTTITGLTNGTSYAVVVRAKNSVGAGAWSDDAWGTPVTSASVPAKPAAPSVTAGDGFLTVSWSPPSDGGSAITDYDVRYVESSYIGCADCGALPWVNWQSSTVSTWRSTTITGLTNGTSYAVVVRAKNSVGAGAWSDDAWGTPVTSASVPAKPAAPSVTAGDGFLTVSWSPPSDGGSAITGYDVWYGAQGQSGQSWVEGTTATSTTITGLTNGIGYTVFVLAQNAEGSGEWSDAASGTPQSEGSVPAKPSQPSVVAGNRSLTVSWSPPADGGSAITGYEVRYSPDTSSQFRTHRTTATRATLSSLTNGTSYTVFVRAQYSQGFSDWSDRATGTPKLIKAPSKPTITLSQRGDTVTLSWRVNDDGGAPIVDYDVYYRQSHKFDSDFSVTRPDFQRMNKSSRCHLLAEVTTSFNPTPPTSTGRITLDYGLDRESPCFSSFSDEVFTTFEFRIVVRNSAGLRSWSPSSRVTLTPWKAPTEVPKIKLLWVQQPGFIGGVIGLVPGVTRLPAVIVEFNTVDEASHYKVEWKRDDGTSGSQEVHASKTGSGWPTGKSITIGNVLETDPKHHFRVIASNSLGSTTSEWKILEDVVTDADVEDMKSDIQNNCSSIDSRNVASEDMRDVLNTVALAAHTRSLAGARFGNFMKSVGKFGRGASWTGAAIWIIDELDKCNGDVGAFVRNLPFLKEIIDGYIDNPYARASNCGGLFGDEFVECFYGE